jgi:large subunit ribosomal protein L4
LWNGTSDMIELAVLSREGKKVETMSVDESLLGGRVRFSLLKQAIVMYHANRRVGTAATKNKSLVEGSTRKLYKQKGTGNARAGQVRTHKRVGGGVAFAKVARDFRQDMPKKQRRLARDSALLAKLLDQQVVVVSDLTFERPKTKDFVTVLGNLGISRSCLVAIKGLDENVYRSARNVPKVVISPVTDLNAVQICGHDKVLFTKEALVSFLDRTSREN